METVASWHVTELQEWMGRVDACPECVAKNKRFTVRFGEWIPVVERWPELYIDVMVDNPKWGGWMLDSLEKPGRWGKAWIYAKNDSYPTHWMPKPEGLPRG